MTKLYTVNAQWSLFERTRKHLSCVKGLEAAWKQISGPADAAPSYRLTMTEHPESDIDVEQLVSALTRVTTDGCARKCVYDFPHIKHN